jgi:hypothetical protein
MLEDMLNDRVTLVKKDGTVIREDIPSLVTKGKVQIHDATLPIEPGDHFLRKLPSGLVEDYLVEEPTLHAGLDQPIFVVHVRRSKTPEAGPQAVIQSITNNFNGANSRVNINSVDNSTNIAREISITKLHAFLDQVKPALGSLPEPQREAIKAPLAVLENEVRSDSPSSSNIATALQSAKTIVEGAVGNLIATGIAGMISSMMSS